MKETIGRGTWLDKVAAKVIEREKRLERSTSLIRVESGLGASGIPHVGNMSDAVRAYGIKLALEYQGYKSELIAYSDDLDGLRKVPKGLPEWLNKHLGEPVEYIQDPFQCHPSYGDHMSSMLLDALDKCRIEYVFRSGAEAYKSGALNEQITKILENTEKIGRKIAEILGQTKYEEVLPYFPICSNCGRLYTTSAYRYVSQERRVLYRCIGTELAGRGLGGCGHEGETNVSKGEGKLSWKVEFSARWTALDIRYEAYGKELIDSVKINDWVSDEILRFPHPTHIRYEHFLDRMGRKIAKSVGNVFTPQVWLRYGTPESLLLLMFKRIAGTRKLSTADIPTYMDEYDTLEDIYFEKVKIKNEEKRIRLLGLYEYVNLLQPPSSPSIHVPYRLLTELAFVAPSENRANYVLQRLRTYGVVKNGDGRLADKIVLGLNWADDFESVEMAPPRFSSKERLAVRELAKSIMKEKDADKIQNKIFEVARRNQLEPPDFFKILYQILIGVDRGPRLGPYIIDIGKDRASKLLLEAAQ